MWSGGRSHRGPAILKGVYSSLDSARAVLQDLIDKHHSHSFGYRWNKNKHRAMEYVSSEDTGDYYAIRRYRLDEPKTL